MNWSRNPFIAIDTPKEDSPLQFFQLIFLLAVLGAALFPCSALAAPSPPLAVVVSIAPQKYVLERIGGNAISVSVLLTPGSDPHSYEPGPSQMRDVAKAAAWFTIGVPFEAAWLPRIEGAAKNLQVISFIQNIRGLPFREPVRTLADLDKALVELGTSRHRDQDHDFSLWEKKEPAPPATNAHSHAHDGHAHPHEGHSHAHDSEDPHVWLSPTAVRAMLPCLVRELGALMPDKVEFFRANAAAFDKEIAELDHELEARFRATPPSKRIFLTFHPSWRYFAHTYRLIELSIEVDGREPGPRSLKATTDIAKQLGITTIFVEPQFPRASARAVANAIGASIVEADPLEENLLALYRGMADKLLHSFSHD